MENERFTCPCQFPEIGPCRKLCSCHDPSMSGVCLRCCQCGSYEQQLMAARRIAKILDEAKEPMTDKEKLDKLKEYAWDVVQAYSGPHGTDRPPQIIKRMEDLLETLREENVQ